MKLRLIAPLPTVALLSGALALVALSALVALGCDDKKGSPPEGDTTGAAPTPTSPTGTAPASGDGYESMDSVPGAGNITGTVSYAGKEIDPTVKVTKDKEACCEKCEGDEHPAGALLVKDGKLKNALVYIDGIKKGKKLEPADVTIDNIGCVFEPHVAIAYKGKDVIAKNSDPVLHNTHLKLKEGGADLFNVALPKKDQEIKKTLRKAGLISVSCDAHDWMQGYVYATTHPYVVVTGDDGAYSLDGVPAGKHKVVIWHEKLGKKELDVDVAGDTKADAAFE